MEPLDDVVAGVWLDPISMSPFDLCAFYTQKLAEMQASPGRWMLVNSWAGRSHVETWTRRGCNVRRLVIPGTSPRRYRVFACWPGKI